MFQYGVLDTARDQAIHPLITLCSSYQCLFAGAIEPPLDTHAPYIVEIKPCEPLLPQWQAQWGNHWGILVYSKHKLPEVRRHLRKFLTVQLPNSSTALFRFYDPRVMKPFVLNLDGQLAHQFLEKITSVRFYDPDAPNGFSTWPMHQVAG